MWLVVEDFLTPHATTTALDFDRRHRSANRMPISRPIIAATSYSQQRSSLSRVATRPRKNIQGRVLHRPNQSPAMFAHTACRALPRALLSTLPPARRYSTISMTSTTLRQTQARPLRSLTPRSLLISLPSRRYVSSPSFSSSSKTTPLQVLSLLFRRYPFSLTIAFATILISSAGILYSTYAYNTHVIAQFAAYPEPVAVKLRRALFYSSIEVSAKDAMRYFREALVLCMQHGMSPMSDEVMGIRLRMAAFLEEQQHYGKAAELLEMVRGEALRWLEEQRWDGVEGNLEAGARPRKERTRVLGKLVGICMKLGELYAGEYVKEREMAEERLVEAVEIVLKEKKRRTDERVKEEDEGSWMSDTEIVAALEGKGQGRAG